MGNLTERQFKAILRRAIAEQSREHTFSEAELIEAGQELGLDRTVIRRILDERRSRPPTQALSQPHGTKIRVRRDDADLVLEVPPAKGRGPGIGILLGTLFGWLVLPVTTSGAIEKYPAFVMLSIPSWIALALLSLKSISLWFKKTTIRLSADCVEVIQRLGPLRFRSRFDADDVQVRLNEGMGSFFRGRRHAFPFLEIRSGVKRIGLLQGFTDAEQEWVNSEIEAWIADIR